MKQVKVEDAIGMILCHDLTEIVPGVRKGTAFRKGHIIQEEDINKLLDIGKRHLYVWDEKDGYLHENDAALRMVKATLGDHLHYGEVKEGKINIYSDVTGLLKINEELLFKLNSIENICYATIHSNKMCRKDDYIAATRVIPLVIEEDVIEEFEAIAQAEGPLIEVIPFTPKKSGIVITGSEVQSGRIEDKFAPVLKAKGKELNLDIVDVKIVGDDVSAIQNAIDEFVSEGVDLVQVTGGMSVDPDDLTPSAIRGVADEVITYGSPVLPGAMFMLAYKNEVPIVGLPGCVMFAKRTVYDLIVPRLLTGERIEREDIVRLGYGGLCLGCDVCTYPNCSFGS